MNDVLFTLEEIVVQLSTWLMEEKSISLKQALSLVYNSKTYSNLQNIDSGLISQSNSYIYDCLMSELVVSNH